MSKRKNVNLNEIISNTKSIKVLEIPVDINLQMEYIRFHNQIDFEKYSDKEVLKMGDELLAGKIKQAEKQKEILMLLAHLDGLEAYQKLDRFVAIASAKIKPWAIACFQESYMFLCAELEDNDDSFFIGSGAGGKNNKMRNYFIVSTADSKEFKGEDRARVMGLFQYVCDETDCDLEDFEFGKNYILFAVLIPIDVAIGKLIEKGIKKCNKGKNILKKHYYVTNVKKPSKKEIKKYLNDIKL